MSEDTARGHKGAGLHMEPPATYKLLLELTVVFEIIAFLLVGAISLLRGQRGNGRPVVVIPGYGFGNPSTWLLRKMLQWHGFDVHPWNVDRNDGLFDCHINALEEQISALHERSGRRVTLVGWSLGGIYSRIVVNRVGEKIDQIVTLASPFRLRSLSEAPAFVRRTLEKKGLRPLSTETLAPYFDEYVATPSQPSTSVFSYSDCVVGEELACDTTTPVNDSIGIYGSHVGMTHNPFALILLVEKLLRPDEDYALFRIHGWRKLAFFRVITDT